MIDISLGKKGQHPLVTYTSQQQLHQTSLQQFNKTKNTESAVPFVGPIGSYGRSANVAQQPGRFTNLNSITDESENNLINVQAVALERHAAASQPSSLHANYEQQSELDSPIAKPLFTNQEVRVDILHNGKEVEPSLDNDGETTRTPQNSGTAKKKLNRGLLHG